MNGGIKISLAVAGFAAAGCAAAPNGVEIRPIADPVSKLRPGADRLADAKGQLAIGNVGLALEAFRSVARLYPDNADAYIGMAACYESMRRYDLAQSKYEAALALDPRNPALLARLAGALDQQGKATDAAEVRGEIAALQSASAVLDQAQAEPAPASLAPAQTVSVVLPRSTAPSPVPAPALPAPAAPQNPELALANGLAEPNGKLTAGQLAAESKIEIAADLMRRMNGAPLRDAAPFIVQPAEPIAPRTREQLAPSPVNMVAELVRRMNAAPLRDAAPMIAPPAPPAVVAARMEKPAARSSDGVAPRLERLSLGEVALLTGSGPVWRGQVVAATPQKLTVRWVPLNTASARPNIRLFNAARLQGLAARNRDYLLNRGWRKIEIADASGIRERSLVLYPAGRPLLGRSLAAQFGFRAQPTTTSDVFVVFLGRDAAGSRMAALRG
jgi:hypothetical protein